MQGLRSSRAAKCGRSSAVIGEAIIDDLAGWSESTLQGGGVRSMSREASSQDKAACEGFFKHLKTEFFYPRDWRAFTLTQFIGAVDANIH